MHAPRRAQGQVVRLPDKNELVAPLSVAAGKREGWGVPANAAQIMR